MLHGNAIGNSEVSLNASGITIDSIYRPTNTNYLFIYLNTQQAQPQHFSLLLQQGRNKQRISYELKARNNMPKAQGFDS